MTFPHLVACISFPLMALGAACFVILRRRKVRGLPPSNTLGLIGAGFIFLPPMLIFAYGNATAGNLLAKDLIFVLIGVAVFLLRRFSQKVSKARALGFVGVCIILVGAYQVGGDFVLKRAEISGTVTYKHRVHHVRSPDGYNVTINGRSFPTTADIYNRVKTASHVRAAIGHASGTIFEIKQL